MNADEIFEKYIAPEPSKEFSIKVEDLKEQIKQLNSFNATSLYETAYIGALPSQ